MTDVNMPKLSDTMEEGTIVEWKKKTGDEGKTGDVLAEVESDKATFDLEAESDGVLSILVEQGVPAKIGAPIARIGDAAEAAPAQPAAAPPPAKQKQPEAPPQDTEEEIPVEGSAPPAEAETEKAEAAEAPAAAEPAAQGREGGGNGRPVQASPLAKRLAAEMGVDIAPLKGSGP